MYNPHFNVAADKEGANLKDLMLKYLYCWVISHIMIPLLFLSLVWFCIHSLDLQSNKWLKLSNKCNGVNVQYLPPKWHGNEYKWRQASEVEVYLKSVLKYIMWVKLLTFYHCAHLMFRDKHNFWPLIGQKHDRSKLNLSLLVIYNFCQVGRAH